MRRQRLWRRGGQGSRGGVARCVASTSEYIKKKSKIKRTNVTSSSDLAGDIDGVGEIALS